MNTNILQDNKEEHYAIATTDTAFKHMFSGDGDEKEIMRSFLQTFVPSFTSDPIALIEFCPVALPPVLREKDERQTVLDLHVRTQNGRSYIIEMQAKRNVFNERDFFYVCAIYANQLNTTLLEANWYHKLRPVIAIQVLDYDSDRALGIQLPDGDLSDTLISRVKDAPLAQDQYIKHYTVSDLYSHKEIDYLQMIQVQLPRAKPILKRKRRNHIEFDSAEWWVELFCFSSEYTDERILELEASGVTIPNFFKGALNRINMDVWAPQMRREYEADLANREAYASVLAVEREEGREEGIKQGREAFKRVFALEMLNDNEPDERITKYTKLSIKELDDLKSSLAK